MRTLLALLLICAPFEVVAAGTFSGTTTATFNVRETIDGSTTSASKPGTLNVSLNTDYSTMRWGLDFDVDLLMTGGPSQSFQSNLTASGSLTSRRCGGGYCLSEDNPSPLSFPDANGKSSAGGFIVVGDAEWSLTDRIVSTTRTRTSPSKPIATGRQVSLADPKIDAYGGHSITVGNYPTNITLSPLFNVGSMYQDPSTLLWKNVNLGSIYLGSWVNGNNTLEVYLTGIPASITLTENPPGDFTSNTVVDAADYVLWRESPGQLSPFLSSYDVWRHNFGASSDGSSPAVPEPSVTLLLGTLALYSVRRSSR